MSFRLSFAVIGALLGSGALGCQSSETSGSGPKPCFVDAPCETDTSKTCKVECKNQQGGGVGTGGGSGGGSNGGTGGAAGAGGKAVDVSGAVVRFSGTTFDETLPYKEPTKISALDVDGKVLTVDSATGSFAMTNVLKGDQWVFVADDSGGSAGIFSTYSYQPMDGMSALSVPVIPVSVLDDVAIQVDVASFTPKSAQLVLRFVDATSGQPLSGVTVGALAGAKYGFDTGGQGAYAVNPPQTGPLGMAVVFNVLVPAAESEITLDATYNAKVTKTQMPIAQGAATFAVIGITTQ